MADTDFENYIDIEDPMNTKVSLRQKCLIHRTKLCLSFCVLLAVLVCFVLGGYLGFLIAVLSESGCSSVNYECTVIERTNTDVLFYGHMIHNTTELQIDIYDKDLWQDRDTQVDLWMQTISENSDMINLNFATVTTGVREQSLVNVKDCDSNTEFRVRTYVWGDRVGESYIDAKSNDKNIDNACTYLMDPNPEYLSNSAQKCEYDVHECSHDDKYSRETRIFFFNNTFQYPQVCSDINNFYPGILSLHSSNMNNSVSPKSETKWWAKKYIGYVDNDTKYELTFTLEYSNTNQAIEGNHAPNDGEFSIRVYTVGDGFTDEWNEDALADITNVYTILMETYGRPGNCD